MPTSSVLPPYCVYVLKSLKDGDLYTGFTTDLSRRLEEHQSGKAISTAPRRPFILLFCEHYLSKTDALRREIYLKTTIGKRTLRLMLADTLTESMDAPSGESYNRGE
jgi:putative endonuclease